MSDNWNDYTSAWNVRVLIEYPSRLGKEDFDTGKTYIDLSSVFMQAEISMDQPRERIKSLHNMDFGFVSSPPDQKLTLRLHSNSDILHKLNRLYQVRIMVDVLFNSEEYIGCVLTHLASDSTGIKCVFKCLKVSRNHLKPTRPKIQKFEEIEFDMV